MIIHSSSIELACLINISTILGKLYDFNYRFWYIFNFGTFFNWYYPQFDLLNGFSKLVKTLSEVLLWNY